MKIIELTIKHYKRFTVSRIKELTYKPNKKIQVILGTNGSGKSSMLREILPNVEDDKKHYEANGYKSLKIEHDHSVYNVVYDRKANRYSFLKDNVELNVTGQKRTQKDLIQQEFKLNKSLYELLLGEKRFTRMSLGERKRWFTEILTQTDYKEALKIYDKTKDRIKELKAWVTLTQNKLVDLEKQKENYTEEMISSWKEDLTKNKKLIDKLTDMKYNLKQRIKLPNENEINNLITDFDNNLEQLGGANKNDLSIRLNDLNMFMAKLKQTLTNIDNQLKEIEDFKILSEDDVNKVKQDYNKINLQLQELKDVFGKDINYDIFKYLYELKQEVFQASDYLSELKRFENLDTSQTRLKDISSKRMRLEAQKDALEERSQVLTTKHTILKEKSSEEPITCPKCGYKHIPDFNEDEFKQVKLTLEQVLKQLKVVTEEYSKYAKLEEKIREALDYKKQFVMLFSNPKNNPVVNYILDKTNKLTNDLELPESLVNKYNTLLSYEFVLSIISSRKALESIKSEQVSILLNKKHMLIESRIKVVEDLNKTKKEITLLKIKINKFDRLTSITDELKLKLDLITKAKKEFKQQLANELLNGVIFDIKKVNTELETKLINYEKLEERRLSLQEELKDYSARYKAVLDLEKLLSPNKGIIGEYINKTINIIITRINEIISAIWTYDLEILGTDIEEGDLTFKFPVRVSKSGLDNIIEDINKGSSSMQEVIDLAFKLVAMEFLDMLDYPLILDEFGRTMDETHRIRAYDYIQIISKTYFSNIFIVSHFESMFSRFINTDVIILDKDNVNYTEDLSDGVLKIKK